MLYVLNLGYQGIENVPFSLGAKDPKCPLQEVAVMARAISRPDLTQQLQYTLLMLHVIKRTSLICSLDMVTSLYWTYPQAFYYQLFVTRFVLSLVSLVPCQTATLHIENVLS